MNTRILLLLVTVLTLRTKLTSDLFRSTVFFAHVMVYLSEGTPKETAITSALEDTEDLIEDLMSHRNILRSKLRSVTPTSGCDCGTCRVVKWAKEQPHTPDESVIADVNITGIHDGRKGDLN